MILKDFVVDFFIQNSVYFDLLVVLCRIHNLGHTVTGSFWVEEPVNTSWSRFSTV